MGFKVGDRKRSESACSSSPALTLTLALAQFYVPEQEKNSNLFLSKKSINSLSGNHLATLTHNNLL